MIFFSSSLRFPSGHRDVHAICTYCSNTRIIHGPCFQWVLDMVDWDPPLTLHDFLYRHWSVQHPCLHLAQEQAKWTKLGFGLDFASHLVIPPPPPSLSHSHCCRLSSQSQTEPEACVSVPVCQCASVPVHPPAQAATPVIQCRAPSSSCSGSL